MDEVPRVFAISDIQSSPVASCVRSSMTYGNETRPLLVDVGLKFEKAEMRMIRRTNEEWLQMTQPTSGGAVTAVTNCCANCVEPGRPQQWGSDLPFFGASRPYEPAGWLALFLTKACDVETIPGPTTLNKRV